MNSPIVGVSRKAVGWHGKLPTIGDFASRGLDTDFVRIWDDWMSSGLSQLAGMDQNNWLQTYLSSPTWRFLLTPGFMPVPMHQQIWTGVVMPSVDRVGRYYPLTLACPLPQVPLSTGSQAVLWSWLHRLEDLAVDALQDDWSIDTMELELGRLGLPDVANAPLTGEPSALSSVAFFEACSAAPDVQDAGQCVWYAETGLPAPQLMCSPEMDASVVRLWSGR